MSSSSHKKQKITKQESAKDDFSELDKIVEIDAALEKILQEAEIMKKEEVRKNEPIRKVVRALQDQIEVLNETVIPSDEYVPLVDGAETFRVINALFTKVCRGEKAFIDMSGNDKVTRNLHRNLFNARTGYKIHPVIQDKIDFLVDRLKEKVMAYCHSLGSSYDVQKTPNGLTVKYKGSEYTIPESNVFLFKQTDPSLGTFYVFN